MNKIFSLFALGFALLCMACADDPKFPDPGFDMLTDKNITVRRDTAESFMLHLNVNAPAGIDNIQLLNGRTYEVIEDMPQYEGRSYFEFTYPVSFAGVDKTRDSVLVYTVRITTKDRRAYNSSFKINLLRLSVPEIKMDNGAVIGTTAPLVVARGKVTTGINTLKSIKIYIDDREQAVVPEAEIKGLSEYLLDRIVPYNFEVGNSYRLRIEIIDNKDQLHNELITVKAVEMKKPKRVNVVKSGKTYVFYTFTYDEQNRVKTFYFDYADYIGKGMDVNGKFTYNAQGWVSRFEYTYSGYLMYFDYEYDAAGRLVKSDFNRLTIGESGSEYHYETQQNFRYRPDGTIQSFDAGITTVPEIQYADGFLPGEKIFAEKWTTRPSTMQLGARRVKSGFVPIVMPTFVENFPLTSISTQCLLFQDLFIYKYVYTKDKPGYGNTEAATTTFPEYSYTSDENGQLQEIVYKEYPNNYYWQYIRFEY